MAWVVSEGVILSHIGCVGFPSLSVVREGFSINSGRSQYTLPGGSLGGKGEGHIDNVQ